MDLESIGTNRDEFPGDTAVYTAVSRLGNETRPETRPCLRPCKPQFLQEMGSCELHGWAHGSVHDRVSP